MEGHAQGQELFNQACYWHQQQQLDKAEQLYRQAVEADQGLVDGYRNLGALLRQLGRPEEGLVFQRKAVELKPDDPGLQGNLGNVLRDLGHLTESRTAFEKAVSLAPEMSGPHLGLAITLNAMHEHEVVIEKIGSFLETFPTSGNEKDASQLLLELGNACQQVGNVEDALCYWAKSQELVDDGNNLAVVLNTAQVLCGQRDYLKAEKLLHPLLKTHHEHPNLLYALGVISKGKGDLEKAYDFFQKALEQDPDYAICLNTLGLMLREHGHIHKAKDCFERALKSSPEFGAAMNNLGSVLKDITCYRDALYWLRRGAEQLGENAAAHSNVLFTLVGYELEPAKERFEEAKKYGQLFSTAPYERWRDRVLWPDLHRKLKIGLISPDFCRHAVSYFIEPLLEQWSGQHLEITLYAAGEVRDDYSERLKCKADHWRDIQSADDESVIQQIIQDEIDILVDLAGHTAGNRLPVLAHKPAPIQATYLGYYGTTGLETVDYWITDDTVHAENEKIDQYSTETIWRLNRGYMSYRPLDEAPDVSPLPLAKRQHAMLGSFNQSRKITQETAENWMVVLQAIPTSHLYLKSKNLGEEQEAKRIKKLFERLGLAPERLHLHGHSPNVQAHLEQYKNLDLALDTFPYTGCTTTADALWMGVPVLTVAGQSMVSRQAAAVLNAAGHSEWICNSRNELCNKAVELLSDSEKLAQTRQHLRGDLRKSQLLDHADMAKELEKTFRIWWRKLIQNEGLSRLTGGQASSWPLRHNIEPVARFSPLKRQSK